MIAYESSASVWVRLCLCANELELHDDAGAGRAAQGCARGARGAQGAGQRAAGRASDAAALVSIPASCTLPAFKLAALLTRLQEGTLHEP